MLVTHEYYARSVCYVYYTIIYMYVMPVRRVCMYVMCTFVMRTVCYLCVYVMYGRVCISCVCL